MNLTLILVVLLAGGFGYWMVANYIDSRREKAGRQGQSRRGPGNAREPIPTAPTWYQVLGIEANASPERIRQAYQQQISLYHPDKVAAMGPEIQALASKKAQDINLAYAEGLRQHR